MRRLSVLASLLFCLSFEVQGRSVSRDAAFIDYLIGNKMGKDALYLLENGGYSPSDTLYYLTGWAAYNCRELSRAVEAFSRVPASSPYGDKSLFFAAALLCHSKDYEKALTLLDSYEGERTELLSYERAGVLMLCGTDPGPIVQSTSYALQEGARKLEAARVELFPQKRKSPFAAAGLSALVPGLGQIYAGETEKGVLAFLGAASLAAMSMENVRHGGPQHWQSIAFYVLDAIFYIKTVCGAYLSVSIYRDSIKQSADATILYNIHFPLRSVFAD